MINKLLDLAPLLDCTVNSNIEPYVLLRDFRQQNVCI